MTGDTPLISARSLGAVFDVSKPWLNRMLAIASGAATDLTPAQTFPAVTGD